jgi:peptidoglycan/LPS O-acetylase OafA/YrhL
MTRTAELSTGASSRLISLDLLRLLAIVLVLGRHMETPPEGWNSVLRPVFTAWQNNGGIGVDLFFVLSGFLVSGLLYAEYKKRGEISLKRFYVRRAWRIYPAFYALIVFSYFFSWLVMDWKMRDRQIFTELFFLQNYQQAYWNHTWTLALEEHFYILLPLALLGLVRRNPGAADPFRAIPYIVGASSLLFLAGRMINFAVRTEYSWYTHAWPTHLRMDSLIFGVGIAYAYHFNRERFYRILRPLRYPMIVLGVATLSTSIWLPISASAFYYHTFGFMQSYLGAAALMVGVLMCRIPQNRITNGLALLGTYSYSIYLWHMALMYWAIPKWKDTLSWEVRTLIYFIGAFVIGIGMAKMLEAPLLRVRDRLHPSRTEEAPVIMSAPARRAA